MFTNKRESSFVAGGKETDMHIVWIINEVPL